jgi:hypothetical protein
MAVPIEVRASRRRVFRLSHEVGEEGICLARPTPFERGEPVEVRWQLPSEEQPLTLRATVEGIDDGDERSGGGRGLRFREPSREAREAVHRYIARRLGLPGQ